MGSTASAFWRRVVADGLRVPDDRPLDDMTAELTSMLGSTNPGVRDGIAYPTLASWIDRGVYDDLLCGLGDGMVAGLAAGIGETGTDTVFRRAFSVRVLVDCIRRNNKVDRLPSDKVLEWGDRCPPGSSANRTSGATSRRRGGRTRSPTAPKPSRRSPGRHTSALTELTVILDVLADRILLPVQQVFSAGEPDRLAAATMAILRRDLVPLSVLEPWIARLAQVAASPPHLRGRPVPDDRQPGGLPARALPPAVAVAAAAGVPSGPAAHAGRHVEADQPLLLR